MARLRNYQKSILSVTIVSLLAFLTSCATANKNIEVVSPFDTKKYLGKWYEIARTDNRFQRGLVSAVASYSLNEDGSVKVINRAYDEQNHQWEEATGKAKFVDREDEGRLKVSFFGPFYGAYNVVAIDPNYQYVLIFGNRPGYMWILSREKQLPEDIKADYLNKAKAFGVNVDALIWDKQYYDDKE